MITSLSVEEITALWRPGSHDWPWSAEYDDLANDPVTQAIEERVDKEGIGFADDIAPILLGSDGRVWDGHHRIVIAMKRGIKTLNVDIVELTEES